MTADQVTLFDSSFGWSAIAWNSTVVRELAIGYPTPHEVLRHLRTDAGDPVKPGPAAMKLIARLQAIAEGNCGDRLLDVKIDLSGLSQFQRKVIRRCRRVPVGETISYGDLARGAGHPGAARAVGRVMSTNRFPLIVPCHRVVGANSLGGFSSPRGLGMKQHLLNAETAYLNRVSPLPRRGRG